MPFHNPVPIEERSDRELWTSIAWFAGIDCIILAWLVPMLFPWRSSLGTFVVLGVVVWFLALGLWAIWGFAAELRRRKQALKK